MSLTNRAKIILPSILGTGDDTIALLLEARRSLETETLTDPNVFWIMAKIVVSNKIEATLAKPDNILIDALAPEFWDATQQSPTPVFIPIHHKEGSQPRWTLLVLIKRDAARCVWLKHYSCASLDAQHTELIEGEYRDYLYKFGNCRIEYVDPIDSIFPTDNFTSALYTLWVIDRIMTHGIDEEWDQQLQENFNISDFCFDMVKPTTLGIISEVIGLLNEQRALARRGLASLHDRRTFSS